MKLRSRFTLLAVLITIMIISVGCSSPSFNEDDVKSIISAEDALQLISNDNVVLVDAQKSSGYDKGHVKGAVNISRNDIVGKKPVVNVLGSKEQIELVMSNAGISNNSDVIIYDNNNNMDSARLWWTMKIFGHENVKVISGGITALKEKGVVITTESPKVTATKYVAKEMDKSMIATKDEVLNQVNDPSENVVLLDTRSQEEFDAGTIPSSTLFNYIENNYKDGTYKSVQNTRIMYLEKEITPEKTVIMYCKTSIRGAQTYLTLYNAGYRNLKLYDNAWVEWSKSELPVQMPSGNQIESNEQDNS